MDREVAIKLLPRLFLHDPTFKERFQREAKLLAQLEHSAIVPVYDFGYHEEQPYMVNRYMRGGSLLDRISQHGALSLQESLAIVSRISSALSAAHQKGIVHRDLKPANILFDDAGLAFIADFGIAKLAQATSTLTGNTLVGTPAYMSPEQFSGEHEIDGRSDQYSLAIVLFEMLSGELPFKGDTTAKLMKNHLMDAPPSIRTLRADLPESVEPVIEKALQKDPADRFETIDAFQQALAAAVNGEPWVSDAAPSPPPPAVKPAEIYQTNMLLEEQVQSPPLEPPKKDVYSTNVLPADMPLPSIQEKSSKSEGKGQKKKQKKAKSKRVKHQPNIYLIGSFLLIIVGKILEELIPSGYYASIPLYIIPYGFIFSMPLVIAGFFALNTKIFEIKRIVSLYVVNIILATIFQESKQYLFSFLYDNRFIIFSSEMSLNSRDSILAYFYVIEGLLFSSMIVAAVLFFRKSLDLKRWKRILAFAGPPIFSIVFFTFLQRRIDFVLQRLFLGLPAMYRQIINYYFINTVLISGILALMIPLFPKPGTQIEPSKMMTSDTK